MAMTWTRDAEGAIVRVDDVLGKRGNPALTRVDTNPRITRAAATCRRWTPFHLLNFSVPAAKMRGKPNVRLLACVLFRRRGPRRAPASKTGARIDGYVVPDYAALGDVRLPGRWSLRWRRSLLYMAPAPTLTRSHSTDSRTTALAPTLQPCPRTTFGPICGARIDDDVVGGVDRRDHAGMAAAGPSPPSPVSPGSSLSGIAPLSMSRWAARYCSGRPRSIQ